MSSRPRRAPGAFLLAVGVVLGFAAGVAPALAPDAGRALAGPPSPAPHGTARSSAPRLLIRPDPAEHLRILGGAERSRPAVPKDSNAGSKLRDALDDYDLRHVRLEIDISDTLGRTIRGVTTQRVDSRVPALSEVAFDLDPTMQVDSAFVDGGTASFAQADRLLRVSLPEPRSAGQSVQVRVAYHGRVNDHGLGIAFQKHLGKAFVWTLSEPSNARYWWPCKDRPDDKADSSDVLITAPTWMTATSNGLLRSVTPGEDTRTWYWHGSYPIATYLVSVTAGDFVRIPDSYSPPSGGSMLIEHFVFPDLESRAVVDFNIAPGAIGEFAERFGPYPFAREKYGATVFGWGGAMEHQTNTSYYYGLIRGDHFYDWVYVHELGHQWWGDAVTCATWADSWLNEGFASWTEAVWAEHLGGVQAYHVYMDSSLSVTDPSGPVYDCPGGPFDGNTVYNKGGWVVHMLRGVLGDSLFFRGLADYRALYEGRSATTEDLRRVLETSSGRDLSWFFLEWVYGVDRPAYRVSTLSESAEPGQRIWLHLDQIQGPAGRFTMPVQIEARAGGVTRRSVLFNDPAHEDISFDLPAGLWEVKVDPDRWILRDLEAGVYGLNIVTTDLAPAAADTPIDVPLVAKGGRPPYTWQLLDPAPPGIELDPSGGRLRGTPILDGEFTFRMGVSDAAVPAGADTQLFTWKISPASPDTGGTRPATAGKGVRAAPNPVLRSVLLSFQADGTGPSEWTIFDLAGRTVVTAESARSSTNGTHGWIWDGLDRQGRRVAPGIYFVQGRVPGQPGVHAGRVLLLQ